MTMATPYRSSQLPTSTRWRHHGEKPYALRKFQWWMERGLETAMERLDGGGGEATLRSWRSFALFLLAPVLDVAAVLYILLWMVLVMVYALLLDAWSVLRAAFAVGCWVREKARVLWAP
jgi:hypothetical protein